ncbi:uncharacterized protein LOC121239619 [Juglans microcarpa x Juglans regia]|uniref:uncharacterized protein LOC121239619 n=1 Tax=Juglans microcarpa x Juglans regia TaxID=2249226 RepID=UPI001B7E89B3|nr:uncharacterized protein LOC121239619 [Juglans microcarpa x Juglans regia]XP_040992830.1 uncharacterized protein LOC121239619 [Juglans microcarpa x Juglans regia]XP_040992831.1 uncharacterized protein LOC121239619 [Juglans microcarpa x Juglans regia]
MEIQHFSHMHPLVFIEGISENEVIVCRGCEEPISDAAYKCSWYCSFFLHKSCTELQQEIQHPVHPKHPLVLIASENRACDGCCKSASKSCFFYHCGECDFDLDIKCASNWQSSAEDGHQHVFVPIFKQIQFTCDICGVDDKGGARVCSICQLLVDIFCARLACTIKIGAHKDHFLTLIFCLDNQVKEQDDPVLCQLCYKTVNTKYGAYYCKECGFVAHLNCAKMNVLQQFDNLDSSVNLKYMSVDSATNVTPEEDEAGTWDILEDEHPFVGEHKFILSTDKKLEDDKFCEVCMQLISGSIFYTCATCSGKCNIFIHDTCGNLPRKKRHLLHRHPLTLYSFANKYIHGGTFICRACKHLRHGYRYRCDECYYDLDIQCSSIPNIIKHEGHQHSLRLARRPFDEKCNGCDSAKNTIGKFVCIESKCNFALGFECAILPVVVKYDEYDRHLLKLTYSVEDDSGEYYCFICEKERNPKQWFYYCRECDFAAHTHCILGKYPYIKCGFTFVDTCHQHPLTFVRKTQFSPPCDICNKPFEGMGIECKQCEFTFH